MLFRNNGIKETNQFITWAKVQQRTLIPELLNIHAMKFGYLKFSFHTLINNYAAISLNFWLPTDIEWNRPFFKGMVLLFSLKDISIVKVLSQKKSYPLDEMLYVITCILVL